MGRVKRVLQDNGCYHLITRGSRKREVFKSPDDYNFYLNLLKKYKRKHNIRIYSYCLMPNHVHLLGQIYKKEDLSRFMHVLNRAYAVYFNDIYKGAGHVWQGRYVSKLILRDQYFFDCMTYIEFNPVRAKLVNKPGDYPWSSYKARTQGKNDPILDSLPEI
ncbi:MAG: transposase [Candidatus Omnitrophica bacterium]|nr:transposase [Candidatus Omnitrophota bacterium]